MAVTVASAGVGCSHYYLPNPTPMAALQDGVVMSAGVRIIAEDGSFALQPHQRFKAPFRVASPSSVEADAVSNPKDAWVGCVLSRLENICSAHFRSLAAAWPTFEAAGARRVLVEVSGRGSYFGLLYLGDAPPGSSGPSGTHYKIDVPLEVLAQAMERPQAVFGGGTASGIGRVKTWILWVSLEPLRRQGFIDD